MNENDYQVAFNTNITNHGGAFTLNGTDDPAHPDYISDTIQSFLRQLPGQQWQMTAATVSQVDGVVRVRGQVTTSWPVMGMAGVMVSLEDAQATLTVVAQQAFAVQVRVSGLLTIGQEQLATIVEHTAVGKWLIYPAVSSSLTLPDLLALFGNSRVASYIPDDVEAFLQITVTQLHITHVPNQAGSTQVQFRVESAQQLPIWPGHLVLHNLYVETGLGYAVGSTLPTFMSRIGGMARIGSHDYEVVTHASALGIRRLYVSPRFGSLLPSLSTLAHFLGGPALVSASERGLQALQIETTDMVEVVLHFNLAQQTVDSIHMHVRLLWAGVKLNVSMHLPTFRLSGVMAADSRIDLKRVVSYVLGDAPGFPEVEVTGLGFSAAPTEGTYSVSAQLATGWRFYLSDELTGAYLALEQVDVWLAKTDEGVRGSLSARLTVAGIPVNLLASHGGDGDGWQLRGRGGGPEPVPIGNLFTALSGLFGEIIAPEMITGLTISQLEVSFNTLSRHFTFSCDSHFTIDDTAVAITVTLNIIQQTDGVYHKRFAGHITVGYDVYDLIFSSDPNRQQFLAAYHNANGYSTNIREEVVALVSPTAAVLVPPHLTITLEDGLLAWLKEGQSRKYLLSLDIGSGINLADLPLIGSAFRARQNYKLALRLLYASQAMSQADLTSLNMIVPETRPRLPANALASGLDLVPQLQLGDFVADLSLPIGLNQDANTPEAPPVVVDPNQAAAHDEAIRWYALHKAVGPILFERVGMQYKAGEAWLYVDAALTSPTMTISLDGLVIHSPLTRLDPQIDLRGLGIAYANGPVTMGGGFLQMGDGAYEGTAVIQTAEFTLSALGAYAKHNGHPSLFVYAFLDEPLGGPSFFFVTGVAAGFGYNRVLMIPPIEQIAQFPLVTEAIQGSGVAHDLTGELEKLHTFIPPAVGQEFLAVGLTFTTFNLINSFALLTISAGSQFEIDILGLSTAVVPTPEAGKSVSPLAQAQMALKVSFVPDEGFLGVRAQLTPNSYILSRHCRLTGGFAFYSWFSGPYGGDFVQTLGGYHPAFRVPAHYPRVPRLGFNWRISGHITIKGQAYYALTAAALMAGGRLEALWHSGGLRAWFVIGADFLISWKPYHYDARVYVNVGVSYTFRIHLGFATIHKTLSAHIGADLHLWGPEFSGRAHVHLWFVSFTVHFGAHAWQRPQPIDWFTFKSSFLPADDTICRLSLKEGLLKEGEAVDWIVNPKSFTVTVESVIPTKTAAHDTTPITHPGNVDWGIAPMARPAGAVATHLTVIIQREGTLLAGEAFDYRPILKKVPTGLWGQTLTPVLNGPHYIDEALTGFEMTPQAEPVPGITHDIDQRRLQYETTVETAVYQWQPYLTLTPETQPQRQTIRDGLVSQATNQKRQRLLDALGVDAPIDLKAAVADDFLITPQIARIA